MQKFAENLDSEHPLQIYQYHQLDSDQETLTRTDKIFQKKPQEHPKDQEHRGTAHGLFLQLWKLGIQTSGHPPKAKYRTNKKTRKENQSDGKSISFRGTGSGRPVYAGDLR